MQLSRLAPAAAVAARVTALVGFCGVVLAAGAARAEGEIELRGVYYKERSTRVVQPMLDARVAVDEDTELEAHSLVDVITSASAAAGAAGVAFTERRYELGAGLSRRLGGDYACGLSGRFSYEPDYRSVFGSARCQVELGQRNTVLGVALAAGRDRLSNAGARDEMAQAARVQGTLHSVLVSTSITQVLSPVAVAGVTYDLMYAQGFLENPYRRVPVGGGMGSLAPEQVPASRLRHAIFASMRRFVPVTRSTWIAGYRLYADDWGVHAHTPELRLVQEIRPALDVHARYRFHWQSQASFYEDVYDTIAPYLTSDVKLSAFTTHTLGLEVESALAYLGGAGMLADARVELVLEYVVQRNHLGNAVVVQTAVAMPFGD